jgi:hypothetical protein
MNKRLVYKVSMVAGLLAVSAVLASNVGATWKDKFDPVRGFALTLCGSVALVATITLPVSALALLVIRHKSPFLVGCVLCGVLYFSVAWPLAYLSPSLLPSVAMALRMYYPAELYWPDHPPLEMLRFAMAENAGPFTLAHLYWTGVFALAGGLLAHPWEDAAPQANASDAGAIT